MVIRAAGNLFAGFPEGLGALAKAIAAQKYVSGSRHSALASRRKPLARPRKPLAADYGFWAAAMSIGDALKQFGGVLLILAGRR